MKELNVKRIEWIDVCKGLGIFLVFIGHTNVSQLSRTLYDWIYSFHMPLFYMLSGLVFDKTKYNTFRKYINRRFMGHRTKRILRIERKEYQTY